MEEKPLDVSFRIQHQAAFDKPRKRKRFFLLIFVIALLIIGGVIVSKKLVGPKAQKIEAKPAATPTPTEFIFPTNSPTPGISPTEEPGKSPTPKPTTEPVDKITGLDRSNLTVEVQNGSGVKGVANQGSDVLKTFGYHIVSIGNADNFDYENTTISVKSNLSKFLDLLKRDLGTSYKIGTTSSDLPASSSADAVVIIGKE